LFYYSKENKAEGMLESDSSQDNYSFAD